MFTYLDQTTKRSSADSFIKLNFNADRGQWSQLSNGTAFLLQFRGVHRYSNAFDFAMLESQLSFVVRGTYTLLVSQDVYNLC